MSVPNLLLSSGEGTAPELLLRAYATLGDTGDLDTALQTACGVAVDLLGFDHAAAVLLSPDGARGEVRAEHPPRGMRGAAVPIREIPVLAGMVRSLAPLRFDDVRAEDALAGMREVLEVAGVHALLAVPVARGDRLFGWLSLHHTASPHAFTAVEVARCQVLARQLAVVVENTLLSEQVRAHAGELESLRRAAIGIASLLQLAEGTQEEALREIVRQAVAALGARSGGIYRYLPDAGELELAADYLRPHHRGKRLRLGEGLAGQLVQTGEPYATESNYREWAQRARVFDDDDSFGAVLEVPLRWQGRIIGVLYIDDDAGRDFTAEHAARLGILAEQASTVLVNTDLREQQQAEDVALPVAPADGGGGLIRAVYRILSRFGVTPLEDRLGLIAHEATAVLNAEACQVLLVQEPGFLTLRASYGHREEEYDPGRRFRIQSGPRTGLTGHIAHERRVFRAHGPALTGHFAVRGLRNEHTPSGQCFSLLAVPLLRPGSGGELLGLLRVENRRGPDGRASADAGFTEQDEQTARLFASAVVTAIENETLLVTLREKIEVDRRREELLKRVFESRQHLRAEMDPRELSNELTHKAVELLDYEAACLYDVNPELGEVVITATSVLDPACRGDREPLDAGLAGRVVRAGTPQLWNAAVEGGVPWTAGGASFPVAVGAPLRRAGGAVNSVLVVGAGGDRRRWAETDREVLGLFAEQASGLLQTALLWNWERRHFVRSSALGRIEEFIRRTPDPARVLPALLTGITAGYGLGFNRAAVFMLDEERRTLHGEVAIGEVTEGDARAHWQAHHAQGMEDVRRYLEVLERDGHRGGTLEERVRRVRVPCPPGLLMALRTLAQDGGEVVTTAQAREVLPAGVLEAFDPALPFVLVPLALSGDVLGLVIADSPFSRPRDMAEELGRVVKLVSTTAEAIDENPARWALFTPEQLAALHGISEQARRPRPGSAGWSGLEEMEQQVVSEARSAFQASFVALWSYDAPTGTFRLAQCAGLPPVQQAPLRRYKPRKDGTAWTVLEQGWLSVASLDPEAYPFISPSTREVLQQIGVRSFQGVALTVGDEQLGVMYINYAEPRDFGSEDAYAAIRFAERVSLTLKQARMLDQVSRARETARVLARVSTAEPLRETLQAVADGTLQALKCDAVTLYRYDPRQNHLVVPPTPSGVRDVEALAGEDVHEVEQFVDSVLKGGRMRVVENAPADPDFSKTRFTHEEKVSSCAAVELRVQNERVGVMFVNFRTPHPFTQDERDNITLFADQAAVAIHNARLYEELTLSVEDLSTALKRVREATALATFGIVDREWRHNVSRFVPTIEGWVQVWCDMLQDAQASGLPPQLAAWLQNSAADFLKRTRDEIGQRPVMVQPDEQMEPVAVNELVREAVSSWKGREGLIDLTPSFRLQAGDQDRVYANRQWLLAAISTLIDNAARAVNNAPRRDVIVGTRRAGRTIEIDFTDTGCGIGPELREWFALRPMTTRENGKGMGVGVIIAQSIAFTYDGEVKLVDHPEGEPGITVRISLPAYEPGTPDATQPVEVP